MAPIQSNFSPRPGVRVRRSDHKVIMELHKNSPPESREIALARFLLLSGYSPETGTRVTNRERKTMEIVIIILQIVCVAGLALGTGLSLYEIMQRSSSEGKRDYATASEFESCYRSVARNRP
jgi:hypothetical protein